MRRGTGRLTRGSFPVGTGSTPSLTSPDRLRAPAWIKRHPPNASGLPCVVSFGSWISRGIMGRGGTRPYREAPRVWPPMRRHFWLVSQQGNNETGWNPSLPGSIFYFDYFDVVTTLLAMAKG